MTRVLLFGASGNLGKEIAREVKAQGYDLTVVVRNKNKAEQLLSIAPNCIIADVTKRSALTGICHGFKVVISALGKSVSPKDTSKPTFYDIDFLTNSFILEEAIKSDVKKFVYVSAFQAEKYPNLTYFKVHHDFSEKLIQSGLNYSIIKPPAIFSAFLDLMQMAEKGQLVTIGSGDKKTNPIYEGDLAKVCVNSIKENNAIIEAGGKYTYTRKQLNEIVQNEVNPEKKTRNIPIGFLKFLLPIVKLFNRNMYDKMAFFLEVIQHDTIAPALGAMRFEDYVKLKYQE